MHASRRPSRRLAIAGLVAVPAVYAAAAQIVTQEGEPPRFRASTAAVVVDVVVRDRDHRPVRGLTAADFDIYEDGVPQTITSFDTVDAAPDPPAEDGRASNRPAAPRAEPSRPTPSAPAVVALVFEQLGPSGRRLAERAATALVTGTLTHADFAGVFAIDRALHVLVPYTNEQAALEEGIRKASTRAGIPFERAGAVPGAEYGSPQPGQRSTTTMAEEPYIRAHATFEALERLVDSMTALPGRKAVVLFSEGLALMASAVGGDSWLSDNRYERFFRLFERANRAHVAFYTFDAGGLRIESPLIEQCFGCAPYVGLQLLAEQTGGAFVENTNDLVTPVRRVAADLRHYYLLAYNPTNPKLDDEYRRITVKVRRNEVTVLARNGYRASRLPEPVQVRPHEIAPLLALDNPHVSNAFPMHIGTLAFPVAAHTGRTAILARVPARGLRWSHANGVESAQVTVMARIRDAHGGFLAYASDRFDVSGGPDRTATGDILFYRETDLPPGAHTLEVAAYDTHSGEASVRIATIEVPKPAAHGPHVSSLLIAESAERATGEARRPAALQFGEWLLIPNLGDPIRTAGELMFAFTIDSGRQDARAVAAILRGGQPMATAPVDLPPPGSDGRIRYVGRIPLPSLPPGTYQLGVTLYPAVGSEPIQRLTTFRIAPSSG